jgi:flagellar basal-body rod protein FlgF
MRILAMIRAKDLTSAEHNRYKNPVLLDKLKIRTVENPRHLDKEGDSFYVDTPESGEPRPFRDELEGPEVLQGYLRSVKRSSCN